MKAFFLLKVELPEELNKETAEAVVLAMGKQLAKDLAKNPDAKMTLENVSVEEPKTPVDIAIAK